MYIITICLLVGLFAGVLSGLIGLGGGIIILPVLIYALNMSQHMAQGTTLAILLPPIGLLAVLKYYQNGYVDIKVAMLICLGFFIGAFFGSDWAMSINPKYLKIACGIMFIIVGIKMTFTK